MLSISDADPPVRTLGISDRGRLSVADGAPTRLIALTRDVLVFPRGPGVVAAGGDGREERVRFADPLAAVWCSDGEQLTLRAFAGERVRFDWFAIDHLAERVPEAAGFLRSALDRPRSLVMPLPPALYLAQRIAFHRAGPEAAAGGRERRWRSGPETPGHADGDDPQADLARRGREVLCRTYRETVPVARIAHRLGCSEGHLSRTFKRWTGLTLLSYRHELRMRAALDRIEAGADNLAALACDLGYASHSHFTTRFERTFGLTPSAYRRLARGWG